MIARMAKVFVAGRSEDRDPLLEALRDLGVVHLAAVEPAQAVPRPETSDAIDRTDRALQILSGLEPAGPAPTVSAADAVAETFQIQRQAAETQSRLTALHRRILHLEPWGDVRIDQIESLRQAGVLPRFFTVPHNRVGEVRAELVHVLGPRPGRQVLVAVVDRAQEPTVPEGSTELPAPTEDRPALRKEAARLDADLHRGARRLAALAHSVPAIRKERARLQSQADWTVASRSGRGDEHLYALQGWVPEERAADLSASLEAAGLPAAVRSMPPSDEDEPPTLVRYPWWARPMEGLFKILGTVPGYREFDVSAAFMIALPIFSAILISDAGYGLIYLLLPILFYRRLAARGAAALAQLIIIIGACSVVWGLVTASLFGYDISRWLGLSEPLIAVNMVKQNIDFLMHMSILVGAIHLSAAHLWRAGAAFPRLEFLSEVGWSAFLWGIYGLVRALLLKQPPTIAQFLDGNVYPYLLLVGGALAIFFAAPSRNPLKMVGLGLAKFPLSAIGTFGDTVSYVRLMAIGLAGSTLAMAFNDMGRSLPWFAMIPVLMAGHALNVALSIISLFAHGVRLNMLEFSNNLGMQWSGYPYEPFSKRLAKEN